jgi:twinkle protein
MDILEIKRDLAVHAADVAKDLLPNGEKEQNEWRAGSVDGEKGRSLGVHLVGAKAGVWSDFKTGDGGDLLDLWAKVKGITLSEALRQAADWLGVERPAAHFQPKKSYKRPPKPRCKAPVGAVRDYLGQERKIPLAVLEAYKIGEDGDQIIFPFLMPDGELALAKARRAENGAKPTPLAKDCEPILFGWQAMPASSREVVITEGEIDALSWAAYGWPAMSVPFGGGGGNKQQWIENEFERMERFERIYISTDMDKPGEEAATEIATRLGRHRCYRVQIPHKDANACLMEGVEKSVMDAAIANAVSLDPEGLRKPTDFTDAVVNMFWPTEGAHVGYRTPYEKLFKKLLFRPAEVTLWSGSSGAGKSQILSDCAVDWIKQGARVCLSSLEMKGASVLARMCRQVGGTDRPTANYIGLSMQWLEQGLLLYDAIGKASADKIIEVFDYARAKYGCDQFIVDSLMRLGVASDDYVGQERAIFKLVDWAVSNNVHLNIVAHSRKGTAQGGPPETEDVKGAMEIGANAFNILTVWRNRGREEDIRKLETPAFGRDLTGEEKKELQDLREIPGVIVNVAKQRNGDFEGKVGLWFDEKTYRYYDTPDPMKWNRNYIPLSAVQAHRTDVQHDGISF